MAQRFDFSAAPAADKLKRTPQGGILANSRPTRVGVLSYKYPDGRTVLELRHPDEVFHPDSLASLAGAPLTVHHPKGGCVDAENYSKLSKGHVGDDVRQDETFVAATVRVQDKSTARMVERGDLKEMSCGYTADVEFTPGTFNGEHYDAIQKNIRYNHVALLPGGVGRAGREVGLRLDSSEVDISGWAYSADMSLHIDADDVAKPAPVQMLDAKDFVSRVDHDKEVSALKAANDLLTAEVASITKQKTDALEATSPAAIDKLVQARSALVLKAQALAGKTELKTDSKSTIAIMTEAVKAAKPELKLDGKDEAYVTAAFDLLSAKEAGAAAAHKGAQETAKDPAAKKEDSADEDPAATARKKMLAYNAGLFNTKEIV